MEFDNTSQEIWEDMQAGTPFSGPKRDKTDDYKEDFYGETDDEGIDMYKLVWYIRLSKSTGYLIFDWEDYALGSQYGFTAHREPVVFSYMNAQQQKVVAKVSAKINRRVDLVSPNFAYWIDLDPSEKKINISARVFYANTAHNREEIAETKSTTDFRISNKYAAIILETDSFEDFHRLYLEINPWDKRNIQWVENWIVNKFQFWLKKYTNAETLNFIYKNVPEFAFEKLAPKLSTELLTNHLYRLKGFDEKNWFNDNSGSMIKLLRLLCAGDSSYLYRLLLNHPALTMATYRNMDDTSEIANMVHTNKSIFVNLIEVLCLEHSYKGLTKKDDTYYIGKGNFQKVHNPEDDKGIIFLQQSRWEVWRDPKTGKPAGEPFTHDLSEGQYYHPMDLVKLIDEDSVDKTPVWVPVIVIKAMADEQVKAAYEERLRLGLDVLAIILGVATLGSSTPLVMAFGLLDIGISIADMHVVLNEDTYMQSEEGREFLELWGKIQLLGVAVAGPVVLGTAFTRGAKLFTRAAIASAKAETKNFLRAALMKMIMEKHILFSKNSFTILESAKVIFTMSRRVFKILEATELQKAGVVFAKLERTADGKVLENGFVVFYRDEMLAIGEAKKVREALKEVWGLKGAKLIAKLDEFYDLVHIDIKTSQPC